MVADIWMLARAAVVAIQSCPGRGFPPKPLPLPLPLPQSITAVYM